MSVQQSPDEQNDPTDEEQGDVPTSIGKDDAFHVLQNARRRAVLRYVLAHDQERFRMRDVAEAVAAWEHDTTVAQLSSDERQRVYIALYQSHLPKLDDHGLIDYDQSRGVVECTPLTEVLDPYLDDGLHAEGEKLTVEEATTTANETPGGVSGVVGALFTR